MQERLLEAWASRTGSPLGGGPPIQAPWREGLAGELTERSLPRVLPRVLPRADRESGGGEETEPSLQVCIGLACDDTWVFF